MKHNKKKHTLRNIFIFIIVVPVLIIGSAMLGYKFINPDGDVSKQTRTENIITSTPPPTAIPETEKSSQLLYTTEYTRMYKEADSDAEVVFRLDENTSVSYIEEENDYTKVSYRGKEGYILSDCLTSRAPSSQKNKSSAPKDTIAVCHVSHDSGTDIFLRKEPSESSEIIDYIPDKTKLYITENGETWTEVVFGDKTGYVKTKYLVTDNAAKNKVTAPESKSGKKSSSSSETMKIYGVNSAVYLRSEPSDSAQDFITTVPVGAEVEVLEEEGSYYKVVYDGETGYIPSKYLR